MFTVQSRYYYLQCSSTICPDPWIFYSLSFSLCCHFYFSCNFIHNIFILFIHLIAFSLRARCSLHTLGWIVRHFIRFHQREYSIVFVFFHSNPFIYFSFLFFECQLASSFLFFSIFHPKLSISIKLQWEQHLAFDKIWERIVLFHQFYCCSTRRFFFRSHFTSENRFGSTFQHCKQSLIFILISFAKIFHSAEMLEGVWIINTELQLANKVT